MDHYNKEYNLTESFPYFNIYMMIYNISNDGLKNTSRINLTLCNLSLFLDNDSKDEYTSDELKILSNKIKYYLCPDIDFKMRFDHYKFGGQEVFLQINFDFTNTSILPKAKDKMEQ